jgi:hypothetical protein
LKGILSLFEPPPVRVFRPRADADDLEDQLGFRVDDLQQAQGRLRRAPVSLFPALDRLGGDIQHASEHSLGHFDPLPNSEHITGLKARGSFRNQGRAQVERAARKLNSIVKTCPKAIE